MDVKKLVLILAVCMPMACRGQYGPRSVSNASATPAPGQSAYDVAVANGFVGTQPQWLASLQGLPGTAATPYPAATPYAALPAATPYPASTPYPAATPYPSPTNAQLSALIAPLIPAAIPGPAGSPGAQGAPGATGATGSQGPAGTNAAPSASVTGIRKSSGAGTTDVAAIAGTDFVIPSALTAETTRATAAENGLSSPSRLSTTGNAPTLAMAAAAGTGASATITGTNLAGTITMTTGLSLLSTGAVMTLTFADGFSFPNGCAILFSPANANFAAVYTKLYATPIITGGRCTGATINTALSLSVSTAYSGVYMVVGW